MLRNWPIRTKLVVILVVPLAALAALSAVAVRDNVDSVRASDRIRVLAGFSVTTNDLVHALQRERFVASYQFSLTQRDGGEITAARAEVDTELAEYLERAASLPAGTRDSVAETLATSSAQLAGLADLRSRYDDPNSGIQRDEVIGRYSSAISELLVLNTRAGSGSRDTELVGRASTLASFSQAKEASAQQRGYVVGLLYLGGSLPPQATQQITQIVQNAAGSEAAWLSQFRTTATPDERQFFDATVSSSADQVAQIRDTTLAGVQTGQPVPTGPDEWLEISQTKLDKMRDVERRIATNLASASESIAASAARQAWIGAVGVTLLLALSIAISLLVASPMIRQLRRLRRSALDTANVRLPSVVERLHRGEAVDASEESFPNSYPSRDEIGQLADAFGTVHRVAVATAVEQAAMRKSIGDTFLNLARRSQALIHRQLKIIDALERKETDPDELEELFRLDHLATRMRRHAEDLIVLSGSKPARGWRRPVPVKDVIRGAVAEVEDYTRVKVLPVNAGSISGHAVGDLIHMLAELIENATSFSPPHTPVHVSGHEVSNGAAIEIEDRGLGMTDEEMAAINDRLANPPPFDLKTSERLGLFVVGRLAERHSIKVKLRPSPYGGTMAIVLVPATLLRGDEIEARSGLAGVTAGSVAVPAMLPGSNGSGGLGAHEPRELSAVGAPPPSATPANGTRLDASDGAYPLESSFNSAGDTAPGGLPYAPAAARVTGTGPGDMPDQPGDQSGDQPDNQPDNQLGNQPGDQPDNQLGNQPDNQLGNNDDSPLMDDLPVFATVRSSWFVSDRDRSASEDQQWGPTSSVPGAANVGPPPPAAADGGGVGDVLGAGGAGGPRYPRPRPVLDAPGLPGPGAGQSAVGDGARGHTEASALPITEVGLPKRTRRSHLAPDLRRKASEAASPNVEAGSRSPDEIRSMMTSFQTNFDRGLEAGRGPGDDDDPSTTTKRGR